MADILGCRTRSHLHLPAICPACQTTLPICCSSRQSSPPFNKTVTSHVPLIAESLSLSSSSTSLESSLSFPRRLAKSCYHEKQQALEPGYRVHCLVVSGCALRGLSSVGMFALNSNRHQRVPGKRCPRRQMHGRFYKTSGQTKVE